MLTKVEDRALSVVGKREWECKDQEEVASQEVERRIMIREIHLVTKEEDRDPLAVERGEWECKGLEEIVSQEIMIRGIHLVAKVVDRAVEKELLSSLEDELEPSLEGGEVVRELRQELGRN